MKEYFISSYFFLCCLSECVGYHLLHRCSIGRLTEKGVDYFKKLIDSQELDGKYYDIRSIDEIPHGTDEERLKHDNAMIKYKKNLENPENVIFQSIVEQMKEWQEKAEKARAWMKYDEDTTTPDSDEFAQRSEKALSILGNTGISIADRATAASTAFSGNIEKEQLSAKTKANSDIRSSQRKKYDSLSNENKRAMKQNAALHACKKANLHLDIEDIEILFGLPEKSLNRDPYKSVIKRGRSKARQEGQR